MTMQMRPQGSTGRLYSPERDLLGILPTLISVALDGACHATNAEAMARVSKRMSEHFNSAYDPELTVSQVIELYAEKSSGEDSEAFTAFSREFVKAILSYHISVMRVMPPDKEFQELDDAYLLSVYRMSVRYHSWPWWRKAIFKVKSYLANLIADPVDVLDAPVISNPRKKEVAEEVS